MSLTYKQLLRNQRVANAMDFILQDADKTLEEQIKLCEIPAPTFEEEERAQYYHKMMTQLGLDDVEIDEAGNVIGTLYGEDNVEAPGVVTMAHLDTVFPRETDVTVKRDEQNGYLYAPGISDNSRSLAAQLSVIRAFEASGIRPERGIVFCANVCEEGLGDLRGSRYLMDRYPGAKYVVAIDGTGMGDSGIVYSGTGSKRYNITYQGPGGHSFGAFGNPSAIHAVGRAINSISNLRVPEQPKTTYNVGLIDGGTSVNTIASQATMLVDMRSNGKDELDKLERQVLDIVEQARQQENRSTRSSSLKVEVKLVGDRPTAWQDSSNYIVRAAHDATRAVGIRPKLKSAGSTDANIPISKGVPAVCISGGGQGGNAHTLNEWFDPQNAHIGVQRCFLLLLKLAGMSD